MVSLSNSRTAIYYPHLSRLSYWANKGTFDKPQYYLSHLENTTLTLAKWHLRDHIIRTEIVQTLEISKD